MRISDLLCKSCKPLRSKNYCSNCRLAIAKLKRERELAENKARIERNEKNWLSPKSRRKRLLRSVNNMTLEQLANLNTEKPLDANKLLKFIKETNLKGE